MRIPAVFSLVILFSLVMLPQIFAANEHEWTGFVFKGGIETNPEKGGPFRSAEACFSWGKSKVWRASDKYMCGIDCKKDERGRNFCKSIETESTAKAAVEKIDAEEEAKARKKAGDEPPPVALPNTEAQAAESSKSANSRTVYVS